MLKEFAQQRFLITLIFFLSLFMFLIVNYTSYRNTQSWIQNREQVVYSRESLLNYEKLISEIKDAETGQRGYILTGDSLYLEPYLSAITSVDSLLTQLNALPDTNATRTYYLTHINRLTSKRLNILKHAINVRNTQGLARATEWIALNRGKTVMDSLRQQVSQLQAYENQLLEQQTSRLINKSSAITFTQVLGAVFGCTLLLWIFWVLRREMQHRQEAIQALEVSNENLENQVQIRTGELHAALEELTANNEELSASNEQQNVLLEKLTHTQQELKMALEAAHMGTWQWDVQTNEIAWSQNLEPIHGLQPGEFKTLYGGNLEGFKKLIHPEDLPLIKKAIKTSLENHAHYNVDFRIVWPDGTIRWMNGQGECLYDKDGCPLRMMGIGTDITDRKLAEENLITSTERFRVALKNSPIVVFNHDLDLRYTWIYNNPGYSTSDNQVLGKTDMEILPAPEAAHIMAIKRKVLESGIGTQEEIQLTIKGNCYFYILTVEPLINTEGRITGVTCASFDITDRKQSEEQLRKSERLKQGIFEGSADALFLLNAANNSIETFNQQAIRLFEIDSKEDLAGAAGDSLQKYPFTEKQKQKIFSEVLQKGFWSAEIEYISKKGKAFWGNTAITLIEVEDNRYFLIRIRDITDRKKAEEAILKSQQDLLAQQRKTEQILAMVEEDNLRKTKELEEARILQMSMLPQSPPVLENLEIAMFMKTCVEVGGDYYDYKIDRDGTLTVVLGDATGHGLKAGIVVATVKSYFQTLANLCSATELLQRISEGIHNLQIRAMYMGLTVIKFRGKHVTIASSGMPPLLFYQKSTQKVESILLKGFFLGSTIRTVYHHTAMQLQTGDTLLMMSDGLPELFNPKRQMLDYERIEDCYRRSAHMHPKEIIGNLNRLGEEWADGKENEDDISLVVMKVK